MKPTEPVENDVVFEAAEVGAKIIKFPRPKLNTPPQTMEEVNEKMAAYRTSYSEQFSEIMLNIVLGEMARDGVDFNSKEEELYPCMILLFESIKALHMKYYNIEHPLQEMAVEFLEDADEEDLPDIYTEED
jgi:hypothetical protein